MALRPDRLEPRISLRRITAADLPTLFLQQLDPESNSMAGTKPFTEEVYYARWERIFADPNVEPRAIIEGDPIDGVIVGTISCFQRDGQDLVGYWIDRPHWGRGIASRALALLLNEVTRRPLHATAVSANAASHRILQRCGFRQTGTHAEPATDRFLAGEVATFVLD